MINSNTSFALLEKFPKIKEAHKWERHNNIFVRHNVVIKARSKKIEYPLHWGGLSIKMVLNGHESYLVDGIEYKLNQNTFLILNHDQYYSSYINENEDVESFTIHFTPAFEKEIISYHYNSTGQLLDHPFISNSYKPEFTQTVHHFTNRINLLKLMLTEFLPDFKNNIPQIEELFYYLYMEILNQQGNIQKKKSNINVVKKSTRDEIHKRILHAKDYMESFYHKADLDLDELAMISCMNKYHLLRCFKQLFGKTPYQYLKQIRFVRAHSLLKTGKYSVAEVVGLCGYDDLSSFNKSFQKTFGINAANV